MEKWVECRVCGHAFQIERFENDEGTGWDEDFDHIYFTVWYPGMTRLSWRERLDSIWRLLTGRRPMGEHVALEVNDAQELGRYLLAVSSQSHPKDGVSTTVPNATVSYSSSFSNG